MWYQQDKPNGPEYSWHENGKKKMHGQSQNGMAIGTWTEWYDNGAEAIRRPIRQRRAATVHWTFWEPSGMVKEVVEYRFGQKVSVAENPSAELNR